MCFEVGAGDKVVTGDDLVSSDGRELVDSRVDEKALEARHSKSHHRLEGEGVHINILIFTYTLRLGAFPGMTPPQNPTSTQH